MGGRTIVYTSHLLEEAEQLCDLVAIVDEGRYIAGGKPSELIQATPDCRRLEDVFLAVTGRSVRDPAKATDPIRTKAATDTDTNTRFAWVTGEA